MWYYGYEEPMSDAEKLVKEFLQRHRDAPFAASQIIGAPKVGEPVLRAVLEDMVSRGEVVKISPERFIYTTNADVASFHILREIAPNITFEEFMAHKEEPHVLVRMSRDRVIMKDPRGGV